MLFTRLASPFVLLLTIGSVAFASPAPLEKRASAAQVMDIFTTLKASSDTIVPQLHGLASNGTATNANVVPLMTELVSAMSLATASLKALPASSISSRQSTDDLENFIAGILAPIAGLQGLLPGLPPFPPLEASVVLALAAILTAVQGVIASITIILAAVLTAAPSLVAILGIL